MPEPFPWALRLEHEGCASIRLERRGRTFRFDPITPSEPWAALGETPWALPLRDDDVVVLTFAEHERLASTAHALRDGLHPTVVAQPEILEWLGEFGDVQGGPAPQVIDGVRIEALPYTPIAYAEGVEIAYKVWAAVSGPARTARRLLNRARLPGGSPVAVQLTLGDRRFVHLNLALHADTPEDWLREAVARFGGADWMLVGVDYGMELAFLDRVERFGARRLLVTDLVSDVRRDMGMPTGVLTPLVDELHARGVDAYVFSTRSSFRFE